MKKIFSLMITLLFLCSCSTISNNKYGNLTISRLTGNLVYNISSSWQVTTVENGEFIYIPHDNTSFGFVVGSEESDEYIAVTDANLNEMHEDYFNKLNESMEEMKMTSYAEINQIKVGDYYGFVIDSIVDNQSCRMFSIHDNGHSYVLAFTAGNRDMTSDELQFAYDYFSSLRFQ